MRLPIGAAVVLVVEPEGVEPGLLEKILDEVGSVESGAASAFVDAAKARVRQIEEHEKAYFTSVVEQASRLSDARDLEVLSARELEDVRHLVTVAGARPGEWAGGAIVLNRVELDPKSVEALRYRAYLYDKLGWGGSARDDFDKILELDPDNSDAKKALKRMGPDIRKQRMQ